MSGRASVIVLSFVFQRQFVRGILSGSVKG
jgi:ABC-type glycerol-3-phosphate transport system permease component